MRRLLLVLATAFLGLTLLAQEPEIKSFSLNVSDLEAKLNSVRDLNDEACALIRVHIASKDVAFDGNIIGDPVWNDGEWLVFMPAAAPFLTIKPKGYAAHTYRFQENPLQSYCTYEMDVVLPPLERVRSLVMPSFSISTTSHPSYGLMVGFVKKFGGYIRAKSDFRFDLKTVGVCNEQGVMDGQQAWLTGNTKSNRWAITAGGLARVLSSLYVYAGVGYGQRTLAWENSAGEYYKVSSSSFSGVESELGVVFRFGAFAVSAGMQNNSFKFWEANLGVGVMF